MQAVVHDRALGFEVRDIPEPEVGSGEVEVRVDRAGFCGTDGACAYCRAGELVRCENLHAVGVNRDGTFAEYVVPAAGQVFDADVLEADVAHKIVIEP